MIVTGPGDVEQLLGVPKLASGTGQAQAGAVIECLDDWNLRSKIKGLCFDTTSSNTGRHSGACTLIEKALEQNVLYFACRHHVMEIVLEKVFTALKITAASSGPDIALFKRFKEHWPYIDQACFETAAGMEELQSFKDVTVQFALKNLEICHPRDDYREVLELALIFLGATPARGVHFQAPGALHHARWMAKIIYCYKMWMFKSQFKLKPSEEHGIFKFLLFVSDLYIPVWFEAPMPTAAPANDLRLLQKLAKYPSTEVKHAATVAFCRHLWYLSEVMVGLAFFDVNLEPQLKAQMVRNMHENDGSVNPTPRLEAHLAQCNWADKELSSFVTTKTKLFFQNLGIPDSFLETPVETWNDNECYTDAERIVKSLKVVNVNVNVFVHHAMQLLQDVTQSYLYENFTIQPLSSDVPEDVLVEYQLDSQWTHFENVRHRLGPQSISRTCLVIFNKRRGGETAWLLHSAYTQHPRREDVCLLYTSPSPRD